MKVITYLSSVTDEAPEARRCAAIILHPADKKHPHGDMHPVIFFGPTKQDAREKAETWWADQLAKEQARQDATVRRTEAMRQAREVKAVTA